MVSSAPKQNEIINLLLQHNKPMSIREIANNSELTYHQVASVLGALKSKGYVKRIRTGLYEATEDAKILELTPDIQIKILKQKVEELELQIKSLLIKLSRR
jgi:predicted transcriptional regulator of viral defense system